MLGLIPSYTLDLINFKPIYTIIYDILREKGLSMITARELFEKIRELKPDSSKYYDLPDSEMINVMPYNIVFPYQLHEDKPTLNFVTDGNLGVYFQKINIQEHTNEDGSKIIGIFLYKEKDDEEAIANFFIAQERIKDESEETR